MKTTFILLLLLLATACAQSEQSSTTANDRLELIPEPDKHLREQYEKTIVNSSSKQINQNSPTPTDSVIVEDTLHEKDQLANDYMANELKPIRENFQRIKSIEKWDSTSSIFILESTEGGRVERYYTHQTLEKITVHHLGEMFRYSCEHYMFNGGLSFVLETTYNYNRPIYWDSIAMNETGDDEVWDFNKSKITEVRSYFLKEKLVHQSNNQDCGSPFAADYLAEEQDRLQTEFKRIQTLENSEW